MRGILTVIGKDKVGIVAAVSNELVNLDINIIDISQTIMDDYFTMIMATALPAGSDFEKIRAIFDKLGDELGVKITIQNAEIFDTMHKL
ncbi:ACT domain-containing protein [Streptococcaceae bacterium ESL0687]|nr:ACT domain-containing protein [Streptococcaceae bacterium ESL0687]